MTFDFGYLVVLGAMVVILFVYRQLDKNNRSLEKIRQFAETVRRDLNAFVEERTATVKDFETVLKVHDKTAVEILKRIQAVESNLLTRTPELEQMQARLDRYALSMGDLETQTTHLDANLKRLKDETTFVDKVSQRIKGAGEQMTALETAFVQIRQEFADINRKDLETVRKNTLAEFERETMTYVQQLREAQKQVEGFQVLGTELETRQDSFVSDAEAALAAVWKETARQAEDLSSVIFLTLEDRIETQAKQSEARMKEELAAREAEFAEGVESLHSRIEEVTQNLVSVRQETIDAQGRSRQDLEGLQSAFHDAAQRLKQDFEGEQAKMLALTAGLKTDLDAKLDAVRRQVSADADALQTELQSSLELDRQTAQALVEEVSQTLTDVRQGNLDAKGKYAQDIEDLQASLRDAARSLKQDFETEQTQLLTLTAQLKSDLDVKLGEVRQQVVDESDALKAELQRSLDLDWQAARALVGEVTQTITDVRQENLDAKARNGQDLESLQAAVREAAQRLQQDFEGQRTQLLNLTSQLKSDLDLQFGDVRQNVEAESEALKTELRESLERDRQAAQALVGEVAQTLLAVRQENLEAKVKNGQDLEGLQAALQDAAHRLQDDFDAEQARLFSLTAQLKSDLDLKFGDVRLSVEAESEALRAELQEALDRDRQAAQALVGDLSQTLLSVRQEHLDTMVRNGQDLEGLQAALRDAAHQLKQDFESEQTQLFTLTTQLKSDLDLKFDEVRQQVGAESDALRAEWRQSLERDRQAAQALVSEVAQTLADARQENLQVRVENGREIESLEATLRDAARRLKEDFETEQAHLFTLTDRLKSDLDSKLGEVRQQVGSDSEALRAEWQNSLELGRQAAQALVGEVTQTLASVRQEALDARIKNGQDIEELQTAHRDATLRLKQDFEGEQTQLFVLTAQLKSDLDVKLGDVRRQVEAESDALRAELQKSLELDQQAAQTLVEEVHQFIVGARRESQEVEQKTLEALEARLKDYEATFAYRYAKMEEAEKDISTLDQNLRQAMERVAERIQRDFTAFDETMAIRRQGEQAALEKKLESTEGAIVRLDKELEELKIRAYDNVSEKLQGFEEVFFEDLQKRTASMTQSLEDWQTGLKAQLEEFKVSAERDRTQAEQGISDTLKARVQELQNASFQQLDRLERQILEAQEAAGAQVKAFRDEMESSRAQLVEELSTQERSLSFRFEQDRARTDLAANEAIGRVERELEARIRSMTEGLDSFKEEYKTGINSSQADFGLWQTKLSQKFKELEADSTEQFRSFKATLAEKIATLSEEFSLQKEELTTRTAEERVALKADLAQIRASIDDLEGSMRSRAQVATEAFEREYEALSQDMQKKNRDLIIEVENRLRDYRASVTDTKEKAEAMQKKIFGKIEDQASLLSVSIEEIEKRQKNFVVQTKVFERADTLKQELQEAVEDLKGDLARIEVQRKDLFEIETSIARVKKLGDETTEKAARFAAEKKRVDLMDSDFQRILGLSQTMELRLEQVTSSHDLLQDIQLRIRKLEDYSKDIEVRYERLEKRREVLDNTTDGVDRNFALLDKVEKTVKTLESDLKAMPGEVEDLKKRLKVLSQGKEDADKAVERLIQLDQTLRDVETRIGRMEQAREWIAGVETRLTETRTAAEEQVQTLATITKAAGNPGPKGKTADADLRQTVLKLARQGWGKEEISRATKLSLGEVELILELGTR